MKIATFNVNNINKRLTNVLDWLDKARPDVACIQELKATDAEVPLAIEQGGYGGVWRGKSHGTG
jgi:exodeoxyribonuclease III